MILMNSILICFTIFVLCCHAEIRDGSEIWNPMERKDSILSEKPIPKQIIKKHIFSEWYPRHPYDRRPKRSMSPATSNLTNSTEIIFSALSAMETKLNESTNQLMRLQEATNEIEVTLKIFSPRLDRIEREWNIMNEIHSVNCTEEEETKLAKFNNFSQGSFQDRPWIQMELLKWIRMMGFCKFQINEQYGNRKDTLLHLAAQSDAAEAAELLIKRGAYIEAANAEGKTPLHYAARNNSVHVLNVLIDKKANVSALDENKWTALFDAAVTDAAEAARILIDNKADVNASARSRELPIHFAAQMNSLKVLKLLIDQQTPIDHLSGFERPLQSTAYNDAVEAAQLLLDHGADVMATDLFGDTALHTAALANAVKLTKLLVMKYKVPVDIRNSAQFTPLHWAANKNSLDTAKILLDHGADINSQTIGKDTPLHLAVGNNSADLVKLLLDNKANPNVKGSNNETPYAVAQKFNCKKCIEILGKYGIME